MRVFETGHQPNKAHTKKIQITAGSLISKLFHDEVRHCPDGGVLEDERELHTLYIGELVADLISKHDTRDTGQPGLHDRRILLDLLWSNNALNELLDLEGNALRHRQRGEEFLLVCCGELTSGRCRAGLLLDFLFLHWLLPAHNCDILALLLDFLKHSNSRCLARRVADIAEELKRILGSLLCTIVPVACQCDLGQKHECSSLSCFIFGIA
mmetsp:Transcript_146218/g.266579  ORF Transcript_146218/g.266579 Transcript_146218/m.266579 type:complete len:211 (-) Transcript_146218:47-679(-)